MSPKAMQPRDDAQQADFIPGIYNYCDRWCERCPLTARCLLFAQEKKYFGDGQEHDLQSDAFWRNLHKILHETKEMILQAMEEHGVDLDAVDQMELDRQMTALDQIERAARHQPLVVDANRYAASVDKWFQRHADLFEEKQTELESLAEMEIESRDAEAEAISLTDACDVVRWYQYQIALKLTRAFSSREECELLDVEAMRQDMLGSAKVALLGIDRSLAAWTVIRQAFPEQADELLEMLLSLDRLRRAAEAQFPDARGFVRPGLDA